MFRAGRRRRCGSLDIYLRPVNAGRPPRIGVVVPRHGHTIVERNRLQRRLRELLRTGWLAEERERGAPRDLVVRAGAGAYGRSFAELQADLCDCLEQAP